MERDASEIPLLGKLAAWPALPIYTGDQDDDFCFVDETTMEGDGAGESHQCNKCRDKQKRKKKKRYPRSPEPEVQPWQAQGSELLYVVSTGIWPANQNELAWEACMVDDDALSNSTKEGMAVEVVESVWSMDSSSKTPRRTLELAGRIGKRPVRMLIDSGAIGNYISAQECTARKIKIEKEKNGKELRMIDGSKVKTISRLRLNVRCGGYHGIVEARVLPEMSKPLILGMPWLVKENPHINWTRSTVVV